MMRKICIIVLSLLSITFLVSAETDLQLSNEDITFLTQQIKSSFPESIKNVSLTINQQGEFTLTGNITSIIDVMRFYNSLFESSLFQNCVLKKIGNEKSPFEISGWLKEEVKDKEKLSDGLKELSNEIKQLGRMPDGAVKEYYPNGQLKKEESYKDYKLNGVVKFYYQNGKLKSERNYKDDKFDGLHREYYENGQLKEETNFKDGKMQGPRKDYYENGILRSEYNYNGNYVDGVSKLYNRDGTLYNIITYKDGKKIGEKRIFKNIKVDKKELLTNLAILLALLALIIYYTVKLKIKRSIGVTILGIIAIISGLLLLYAYVPLVFRHSPKFDNLVMSTVISIISFLVCGIFILRRRNWARILAIVLATIVLFMSVIAVSIFVFATISTSVLTSGTFPVFIRIYLSFLAPLGISVWFIIYLTRPKVKAQFTSQFEVGKEVKMNTEINKYPNPWSARKEIGFLKALLGTVKQVLFRPGEFFANLEVKDSYAEPYYFYLITAMVASIIYLIVEIILKKSPELPFNILIFSILLLFCGIFISAAIIHLFVILFKGKGGFKGTFNVLAYAAAPAIFIIIPFLGSLISGIWCIIVGVIGFERIHKLNTTRAVLAYVVIPSFVFAAIGIPLALRNPKVLTAKLEANEVIAQATLRTISTSIETYDAVNNKYPTDESELVNSKPAYLSQSYNNATIKGYRYSFNLTSSSYEVTAIPEKCGVSGNNIFTIKTGAKLTQEECK